MLLAHFANCQKHIRRSPSSLLVVPRECYSMEGRDTVLPCGSGPKAALYRTRHYKIMRFTAFWQPIPCITVAPSAPMWCHQPMLLDKLIGLTGPFLTGMRSVRACVPKATLHPYWPLKNTLNHVWLQDTTPLRTCSRLANHQPRPCHHLIGSDANLQKLKKAAKRQA